MLILWGVGTTRTIRPHWAFAELDLDFECRAISPRSGETHTAEFTALTARQKVPLLQDDDLVLTESAAIIWYLSETYGQEHNRLIPTGPRDRARCLEWCFFILGELDETSLYVMRRHSDMRQVYGEAPAAIEGATTYFQKQMRTVAGAGGQSGVHHGRAVHRGRHPVVDVRDLGGALRRLRGGFRSRL
jgi:glutathione S-transferase